MQNTEVAAEWGAGDEVLRAAACCCGLGCAATCLGASTEMPGSGLGCDHAVPLDPHSSGTIDKTATATFVMKSDEPFIAMSSQDAGRQFHPGMQVST
ncbi:MULTISPECIES: hypothetical protein [Bradyrhizobium]|jgi:hypothetical protein|uniref:hypothetical protein n=1 Tax=Bradyrhizobium TaxID=374 RepID=UPI0005706E4E|nr:hypothetical protein [Bradyrhizobium elkanii]WLA81165.1 hypothetical protein QNJ99_38265 [Bradyrhizobium elkanii]